MDAIRKMVNALLQSELGEKEGVSDELWDALYEYDYSWFGKWARQAKKPTNAKNRDGLILRLAIYAKGALFTSQQSLVSLTRRKRGPGRDTHEKRMRRQWAVYPRVFVLDGEVQPLPPRYKEAAAELTAEGRRVKPDSLRDMMRRDSAEYEKCAAEQLRVHKAGQVKLEKQFQDRPRRKAPSVRF